MGIVRDHISERKLKLRLSKSFGCYETASRAELVSVARLSLERTSGGDRPCLLKNALYKTVTDLTFDRPLSTDLL